MASLISQFVCSRPVWNSFGSLWSRVSSFRCIVFVLLSHAHITHTHLEVDPDRLEILEKIRTHSLSVHPLSEQNC